MTRILVIGAGVGGLAAAAVLARLGVDVTVLEAHVYPGGCAGTFYHQGYRFDAGATLAGGFYAGGPMDLVAQAAGVGGWPTRSTDPAMVVHLPDGTAIARRSDDRRWEERYEAFGRASERFWRWQERTADGMWDLALRAPPWPPQTPREMGQLVQKGFAWLGKDARRRLDPGFVADALRPVAAHLRDAPARLRTFLDAQLLISAQTTSRHANALYGAAALDLPRRGVVHLAGGMGAISQTLAETVERHGGKVHFRQEVRRIVLERGRPVAVTTKRGETFPADVIIANLPPWNIAPMLGDAAPRRMRHLQPRPKEGWGAFVVYVGFHNSVVPKDFPLHHQVVVKEPLGEGNSVFLSLSPVWDHVRAPENRRALTLSTHTQLDAWWQLHERDREAYETLQNEYTERALSAAAVALPGLADAAELVLPGTPVTFQRFTRRAGGWVGGFPQTHLLRAWRPKIGMGLWMVGDSIFPGQSTAAVALGGMRVARAVQRELENAKVSTFPAAYRRSSEGV
jgi:C-3',4' desaturase CrtD